MWPSLKGKEKLIVRRMPVSNLKLGDLVLYKADNQLVCHRLVKKAKTNGGCLIFSRGDASFGSAEPVNERMFVGKVVGIIKNGKITNMEGVGREFINRISIISSPLFNFMVRSLYQAVLLPLKHKNLSRTAG